PSSAAASASCASQAATSRPSLSGNSPSRKACTFSCCSSVIALSPKSKGQSPMSPHRVEPRGLWALDFGLWTYSLLFQIRQKPRQFSARVKQARHHGPDRTAHRLGNFFIFHLFKFMQDQHGPV